MPALVNSEEGLKFVLNAITGAFNSGGVKLRLFKNNHTPVEGDTIGNYTEADFSGYAAVAIGPWNAATYSSGSASASATSSQTFTNSTGAVGNDIYGYYVTDAGNTTLYFAQIASTVPIDMNTALQSLTVQPVYTTDNP
jgi:hypothetical protein